MLFSFGEKSQLVILLSWPERVDKHSNVLNDHTITFKIFLRLQVMSNDDVKMNSPSVGLNLTSLIKFVCPGKVYKHFLFLISHILTVLSSLAVAIYKFYKILHNTHFY